MELITARRRLIQNAPHLVTVTSGNTADSSVIAHFVTGMAAPVTQCRVDFAPVQAGSGTPSPTNIRAISGHSSIAVTRCGKNLYDQTSYPLTQGYWVTWSDLRTDRQHSNYAMAGKTARVPCDHLAGATVTLNKRPGGANPGWNFANEDSAYITVTQAMYGNNSVAAGTPWTILLPDNAATMAFTTVSGDLETQIELGSSSTDYEAYNGQTVTATLPDTFYGGYVDLVTGELVVTHGLIVLDGTEEWYSSGSMSDRFRFRTADATRYNMVYGRGNTPGVVMADWAYAGANGTSADDDVSLPIITAGHYLPQFYIGIPKDLNITTVEELKTYLGNNPLSVVTHLATPVTYQLSAQTLKTLRGINNVWSPDGDVTVTYWGN